MTSKDTTKEYKDATIGFAAQINETSDKLKKTGLVSSPPNVSAGLATGFAELANVLLKAKASTDAKKTIQQLDPIVNRIFNEMADLIGASNEEGIRGTVFSNWELLKGKKSVEFLKAKEDEAKKHDIAAAFSEIKGQQTAQDLVLASLQRSLRALADAHHALAKDSKFEVVAAIAVVKEEAKDTNDIYNRMKVALAAKQ